MKKLRDVAAAYMGVLAVAAGFGLHHGGAFAQKDYPSKPIRVIVPFTPGGGNDTTARVVAAKLPERIGQPVIVENRPGAGGNVGAEHVAKSAPDGHTLLLANNGFVISPWLEKNIPFDIAKDFAPIGITVTLPMVVLVAPSLPVKSIRDLIAYAKANPTKLSYATPGLGTPHHLATELFKGMTSIRMEHIPYKGSAGMLADLISDQVQIMFVGLSSGLPYMQSGKIRAIGVAERERLTSLPDLPTVEESLPGYEAGFWFGFMAPAGTPERIVRRLSEEIRAIVHLPDISNRLKGGGFEVRPTTPEEMRSTVLAELKKWEQVVKTAQIKPH